MTGSNDLRLSVLGVPVDAVDMSTALTEADGFVSGDRPRCVLAVNPEKVMAARQDPVLLGRLRDAALLLPDGIGVVLAGRVLGGRRFARVAGADFMPALCALAAKKGYGVFVFGASEESNRGACEELQRRLPGLRIVGRHHGFVDEDSMEGVLDLIRSARPEFLFVALGSPRQELWMERYLNELPVKVCQGVGGTLDVLAGRVARAPAAWRRAHLEWLYRLLRQPTRAFRQIALLKFAGLVLLARLGWSPGTTARDSESV